MQPLAAGAWLQRDDCFAGQMRLRDHLIAARPGEVLAEDRGPAGAELLAQVLEALSTDAGYRRGRDRTTRPDGVTVPDGPPLATIGRLVQEDMLILERPAGTDEHVLTAGVLCFPSHWSLGEKLGRPLRRIHRPVPFYDDDLACRVQRLFDALRPDQPLWRMNWLLHDDPALFAPRREGATRTKTGAPRYLRAERQTLIRLPKSGAVVFSIKTDIVPIAELPRSARDRLRQAVDELPELEQAYKSGL